MPQALAVAQLACMAWATDRTHPVRLVELVWVARRLLAPRPREADRLALVAETLHRRLEMALARCAEAGF